LHGGEHAETGCGTPVTSTVATPGTALAFDGVDDYVWSILCFHCRSGNSARTIEFWVNVPANFVMARRVLWGTSTSFKGVNGIVLSTTRRQCQCDFPAALCRRQC